MTIGERESKDLQRAREYIELARPRVHVRLAETSPEVEAALEQHYFWRGVREAEELRREQQSANLTEALFGAYTCTRCNSYGHDTSDHGGQR